MEDNLRPSNHQILVAPARPASARPACVSQLDVGFDLPSVFPRARRASGARGPTRV